MRRSALVLAVVLGAMGANEARAQFDSSFGFNDPFMLYYGFYLPRQQALANQPGPSATLNYLTAERQQYAVTNQASLYDPASPYGRPNYDPAPLGEGRAGERIAPVRSPGLYTSHLNGNGPAIYYGRAQQYYPTLRSGRGPNANVAVLRAPRGGGRAGAPMPQTTAPRPNR